MGGTPFVHVHLEPKPISSLTNTKLVSVVSGTRYNLPIKSICRRLYGRMPRNYHKFKRKGSTWKEAFKTTTFSFSLFSRTALLEKSCFYSIYYSGVKFLNWIIGGFEVSKISRMRGKTEEKLKISLYLPKFSKYVSRKLVKASKYPNNIWTFAARSKPMKH